MWIYVSIGDIYIYSIYVYIYDNVLDVDSLIKDIDVLMLIINKIKKQVKVKSIVTNS